MKDFIDYILSKIIHVLTYSLSVFQGLADVRVIVEDAPLVLVDPAQLAKMTKVDLEKHAQDEFGLDLDRRKTKAGMIDDLLAQIDAN
jgi:hypothetical protein|tara:strand:+ start:521 stop:781 length:261 start_codon:yes stop_codon:yes gene_type:complete